MKRYLFICLVLSACSPAAQPAAAPVAVVDVSQSEAQAKKDKAEELKRAQEEKANREKAAEIASALAELDVTTIGALGGDSAIADGILGSEEVPTGLLDSGPSSGTASGTGTVGGGTASAGGGGSAVATKKPAARPQPDGTAQVRAVVVTGGTVSNAKSVATRMRGRFRACYRQLLRTAPKAGGNAMLKAKIGPYGQVQGVSHNSAKSLKSVIPCLKAVVRSGAFAPPSNGSATVSFVVKLERK